ncbi:MAG TPA: arginase family protein [Solirubrobacteraceae bacterium]
MEGAVTALRCRTSDRTPESSRGAEALARAVGERLGVEARMVGSLGEPRAQDWADDLRDSRGCLLEAGGQVDDALAAGAFPVLTAGHCTIALTTLPTVARHRPDAKVLWLDAHGDFNTPQTSPSGFLGGMPLAGACGAWDSGFGAMDPARVVLCGVRDLDEGERALLERSPATVIGPTLETLVALQNALDGTPTYVHLDCDVLDPELMPAEFPSPGGLTEEKLYDLLDAVADACEVVGVQVTALNAPDLAPRVADLIEPLLPKDAHGLD